MAARNETVGCVYHPPRRESSKQCSFARFCEPWLTWFTFREKERVFWIFYCTRVRWENVYVCMYVFLDEDEGGKVQS